MAIIAQILIATAVAFPSLALASSAPVQSTNKGCILGTRMQKNPHGQAGTTYGQQYFSFDRNTKTIRLRRLADSRLNMFLYVTKAGKYVEPSDWCFDHQQNSIRLLRLPPRLEKPVKGSGMVNYGSLIWIGFNPVI